MNIERKNKKMAKYCVLEEFKGYRLDKYLTIVTDKTRSFLQNNIINIKVNGMMLNLVIN